MQVKKTCVSRDASPFITKADVSLIPSPITKVGASPFITNAGVPPIQYIERRVLEWRVSILYPSYKSHSELGKNSGGTRSYPVLTISFSLWMCPSNILAVMQYNSGKG
jgi:hypothetical protein